MKIATARIMRELDRETIEDVGVAGVVLMEAAGRGIVRLIAEDIFDPSGKSIAIFAGKGNNGGDGFVAARHLLDQGAEVTVFLFAAKKQLHGDALTNQQIWEKLGGATIEVIDLQQMSMIFDSMQQVDLIVDALLGTGLDSEVRGLYGEAIHVINAFAGPVVAADLPSGLHSDTGQVMGAAVRADFTATFGLSKLGLETYPGMEYAGNVKVIDIGLPRSIVERKNIPYQVINEEDVSRFMPERAQTAHKGSFGHLVLVAGSAGKTGAALLCGAGALRGGAGLVTLATSRSLLPIYASAMRELMTAAVCPDGDMLGSDAAENILALTKKKAALIIGPGLGVSDELAKLIETLISSSTIPLVIDADGINNIAGNTELIKRAGQRLVLTPHPGEMARLAGVTTGEIQKDRVAIVREFAREHGVIVLLKGARSIIAGPEGNIFINPTGNPVLASGGTGDVLAGLIGALLAQGCGELESAICGAYLHGLAADLIAEQHSSGILAGEIADALPEVITRLRYRASC
jgi:ADP-dependent NAD(P)H-hydrate dehydratase / NAD(P)H-hydrate epimerase